MSATEPESNLAGEAASVGVDVDIECALPEEPTKKPEQDIAPPSKFVAADTALAVFDHIQDKAAGTLYWKNIGFSVSTKKGRFDILKDVSGHLKPGELTCILGPSGSGKTTLLNTLSGRTRPGGRSDTQISGEIELNGQPLQPWCNQHCFGYVMQEDSLFATETPREILTFSAKLRLGVADSKIKELVDDMLSALGLQECADTMAGSDMIKGISGGQKKRTAIAAELITNPAITFLDEPTSGLDTAAAYKVVSVLKQLANAQQSVLATIHQPSSEIFFLFDQAIFIAKGQIVYHGPPSGIRAHFEGIGHICPADYNPADFVMFTLETTGSEAGEFEKLVAGWTKLGAAASQVEVGKLELPSAPRGKGFCRELALLSARQYRNTVRDKGTLVGRFGITVFLNLVFSLIFFQACDKHRDDYTLQTHLGALTMVAINAMFGAVQPAILTFPSERPVFLREHASQMYGVIPYFLSKTVIEFVLLLLQTNTALLLSYNMMGFHGQYYYHMLACFLIGASASSIGLFFGCSIRDIKTAMEVSPLAFVPQILFAGFFISMDQIPIYFRWLQYVCGLKWGVNIMIANEVGENGLNLPNADEVLAANSIEEDRIGIYFGVILALIVGFRSLSMVRLRSASKSVYS